MKLEFTGKLWFYEGPAAWCFVTVPEEQSLAIRATSSHLTPGWGSIPVHVRIGKTEWKTSLFPKDDHYDLPIKASVRKAEKLEDGDEVTVKLEIG